MLVVGGNVGGVAGNVPCVGASGESGVAVLFDGDSDPSGFVVQADVLRVHAWEFHAQLDCTVLRAERCAWCPR